VYGVGSSSQVSRVSAFVGALCGARLVWCRFIAYSLMAEGVGLLERLCLLSETPERQCLLGSAYKRQAWIGMGESVQGSLKAAAKVGGWGGVGGALGSGGVWGMCETMDMPHPSLMVRFSPQPLSLCPRPPLLHEDVTRPTPSHPIRRMPSPIAWKQTRGPVVMGTAWIVCRPPTPASIN
jgi:hypothetical protein